MAAAQIQPTNPNNLTAALGAAAIKAADALAAAGLVPAKDTQAVSDRLASNTGEVNFDGGRCAALGASLLDALAHVGPQLRGVAEPKFYLPDDAYVAPSEDAAKVDARLKELGLA